MSVLVKKILLLLLIPISSITHGQEFNYWTQQLGSYSKQY
jgi:hypothetical protein